MLLREKRVNAKSVVEKKESSSVKRREKKKKRCMYHTLCAPVIDQADLLGQA